MHELAILRNIRAAIEKGENALAQIDELATFILEEVPGEPSRSEGAVDTAIRLLRQLNVPLSQVIDDEIERQVVIREADAVEQARKISALEK